MKVKELIDKLKNFNQELDVKFYRDHPTLIEVTEIFVEKEDSGDNILVLD